MLVHWIVAGVGGSREEGYTANLASNRYRAILPARGLEALGTTVEFIDAARWRWDAAAARPEVVVLGKLLPSGDADGYHRLSAQVLAAALQALRDGVPVVADFNDDHFDDPVIGAHWRRLAKLASACLVGSDTMSATVRRHTERPIHTVGDPIGSPRGEPRVFRKSAGGVVRLLHSWVAKNRAARLKLAWYGNPMSWPALQRWMEPVASFAAEQPLVVWAVTRPSPAIDAFVQDFNARHAPNALMELVPWDEETQWAVVRDADVVLLPSDPLDTKKAVKTANRLTDALHAGRYVVASPLPAYQPFAEFVCLTDDVAAGLRRYLDAPAAALTAIERGQGAAIATAGLPTVSAQWQRVFDEVRARAVAAPVELPADNAPQPPEAAHAKPPVRLNLGCGDKILPGYVNVDVVESRAGKRPDVLCDLHDLSVFDNNHADEIMAIHVVEHFWRWEVEDILREWVRVLRPGGRMVLECPNLISACEAFLKDPDKASAPTKEGQRTMWVFYGDPAWKDPYMIHRWGYTPSSLGQLMSDVGLVNVRQEPAQFKLREPRDMRIVGEKPPV